MYFLELSMQICGGFFPLRVYSWPSLLACIPQETEGQTKPCLSIRMNLLHAGQGVGKGISHETLFPLGFWTCF